MRLSLFKKKSPPSEITDIPEIDVTPVMNMFIILIPFLVSMAIFTHLSIIEFSLPPNVGSSMNSSPKKPSPKLTIRIGDDYLGVVMGEKLLDSLLVENNVFPFDQLSKRLVFHKQNLNYNNELIIASKDNIPFKLVVRAMDLSRDAGFEKIGLSSAAQDAGDLM
jgi:biopolymer transport protein ExbD